MTERGNKRLLYEYDSVGNLKQADNGQVKLVYNNADTSYDSDPFNRIKKIAQVMPDGNRYNLESAMISWGRRRELDIRIASSG